jgi:hypothetical protein
MVGKENQMHHGQTMMGPTQKSLMLQLVRETESGKYENKKSLHYFSDTAPRLGGTQCPNKWHRCDPHGKEGRMEC